MAAKVAWELSMKRDEPMQKNQQLKVCVAGATGWAGRAVALGVVEAPDLSLVGAVSRSGAGGDLGAALGQDPLGVPVYATVREAVDGIDVLIDYTSVAVVKANTLTAIEAGVSVVIGASGLTASDFEDIDAAARDHSVGVVAAGNFSLTAAMCQAAALLAARHLPQWEVIDYAGATKPDVPSGTARELAERLGDVHPPLPGYPIEASTARTRRAARTSTARRSTRYGFRASSCRPRSSSGCPTSA